MNKENTSPEKVEAQKGFLAIPFDNDQFKDFIIGLLGKPQTITKRVIGDFELELADLQNFHELLNQRISQQNNGKLIQLTTQIFYSDQSSVILSSYDELISYNEVKPVVSEMVKMTWSYLIHFEDKKVPEKQEIELSIVASNAHLYQDIDIPFVVMRNITGQFNIRIEHTARTWGSDIESLLVNQIKSITNKGSKFRKYINRKGEKIGFITGLLFLLGSIISVFLSTRVYNSKEIEKVSLFIKDTGVNDDTKLNYILEYIAENGQDFLFVKGQIFILISIIIAIFLGAWVASLAEKRQQSYLVLTREAIKYRDEQKAKTSKSIYWFFFSIAVSIITGLASRYLFLCLTGI